MARKQSVIPGLEVLARARPRWLKTHRVGLLMHQASVTRRLEPARDVLHRLCGNRLTALFGPQHGIAGEQQDNMIESSHGVDGRLGIPVYSLYSETRSPTAGDARADRHPRRRPAGRRHAGLHLRVDDGARARGVRGGGEGGGGARPAEPARRPGDGRQPHPARLRVVRRALPGADAARPHAGRDGAARERAPRRASPARRAAISR